MHANPTAQRIEALLDSGSYEAAIQLAVNSAQQGDADALHLLALWHVHGELVERNFAAARTLFGRASGAGHVRAAINHAVFVAQGAGGLAPNWESAVQRLRAVAAHNAAAAEQLAILDALTLDPYGDPVEPPAIAPMSRTPEIGVIRHLFTPAECAHIRTLADPLLTPAIVVDSRTGRSMQHPVRTSDSAVLGPIQQDLVLEAFNRRIAAATRTRTEQGEPLTVLRYRPGEQYRLHHDCLPGETNQRRMTVICYLNEDYRGGTTGFPVAGIDFRGKTGDALVFCNTLSNGSADERCRHAGLPVTEGEKWIATRWIRYRDFDPWGLRSPAHPSP